MADSTPKLEELAELPISGLLTRFSRGVENFDRRIFDLTDDQLDTAFLPSASVGRWPVRVLLGHLADAELMQTGRMRRTVGEENPVLSLWDENAFIDAGLYGKPPEEGGAVPPRPPIGAYVAVVHTLRRWMAEWLGTLEPVEWDRRALHPERGELTLRAIVEYTCFHLEHHAWYLNRKVEKFLGPPPPAGHAGPGNPGPTATV